jgi:hypothetical protein
MSLADFGGKVRLVRTQAQAVAGAGGLELFASGDPDFKFAVYPALPHAPSGDIAIAASGQDGVFQTFEAHAPARPVSVTFTKIRDALPVPPLVLGAPANTTPEPMPETFAKSAAWTIAISRSGLTARDDAFLRISARGDVARLFAGTQMLDDRFLDGSAWEIGLKHFSAQTGAPLTLTVLPLRSDAPIYLDGGVAKMVQGSQTASVSEVSIVPQYRLRIRADPPKPRRARGTLSR